MQTLYCVLLVEYKLVYQWVLMRVIDAVVFLTASITLINTQLIHQFVFRRADARSYQVPLRAGITLLVEYTINGPTRESVIHLDAPSWSQAVQITGKIMHVKLALEVVDLEKHQSQLSLTNLLPVVLSDVLLRRGQTTFTLKRNFLVTLANLGFPHRKPTRCQDLPNHSTILYFGISFYKDFANGIPNEYALTR